MKTTPPKKWTAKHLAPPKSRIGGSALKGKLVRIGNSRGVRLPKTVIEQAGLSTDIEIAVRDHHIIIRSAGEDVPRAGWEELIKKALLEEGDDFDQEWLETPWSNKFDQKEWTW